MAVNVRSALFSSVFKKAVSMPASRYLTTSQPLRLKQSRHYRKVWWDALQTISFVVNEVQKDKEIIISAEYVQSPREPYLVGNQHPSHCALCSSGLDLKHTDVLILSQFLRSDGCMLPRRITGLCKPQQKRVSTLVAMAQKAGRLAHDA